MSLFDGKPLEREDIPEATCPECGANWAAGDDCDEDCPLDEAYQSEMADEED